MSAPAHAAVADADRDLISRHLPPGRTYEEAVDRATERREYVYSNATFMRMPEADRLYGLELYCIGICGGHQKAGQALAKAAIWAGDAK